MIQILLIEDSATDAQHIKELLNEFRETLPHDLHFFSSLGQGFAHLKQHQPDLLLLDLEFTYHNITALPYLDSLPDSVPVLIVSHLSHYQLSLAHRANIKGFIPKSKLDTDLLPALHKLLDSSPHLHPVAHTVKFPPLNPKNDFGIEFNINHIRYIDFFSRHTYHVYLTDGTVSIVRSVSLKSLVASLQKQEIDNICQISRNQLINRHYISSIKKIDHSRISVKLVNLDTEFIVGKQFETSFHSLLTEKEK